LAVHIRLKRQGRRKRPFYRVIVIDSRSHREGREIERLGWYDPVKEGLSVELKEDRIFHWLGQGAIPTDTVNNLMRKKGLAYKWHLMKTGVAEDQIETEMEAWATRQLEKAEKAAVKKAEKKAAQPTTVVEDTAEEVAEVESPAEEIVEASTEEAVVEETVAEVEVPVEEAVVEEVGEELADAPTEEAPEVEAPGEENAEVTDPPVAEEVVVEEPAAEKVKEEKTEE
jgi:small subunit ribosomal protein S16